MPPQPPRRPLSPLLLLQRCRRCQVIHSRTMPTPRCTSTNGTSAEVFVQQHCPCNGSLIKTNHFTKVFTQEQGAQSKVFIQERCRVRGHPSNDRCSVAHPGAMLLSRHPCNNRALANVVIQYAIAYDKVFAWICSQLLEQQIVSSTFGRCSAKIPRRSRASLTAFGRRSAKML